MSIKSGKPVHVLLVGSLATAKSLFMSSLIKLERPYYTVGSCSTKSGIFDYLSEYRPRYFTGDKIESEQTRLNESVESEGYVRYICI